MGGTCPAHLEWGKRPKTRGGVEYLEKLHLPRARESEPSNFGGTAGPIPRTTVNQPKMKKYKYTNYRQFFFQKWDSHISPQGQTPISISPNSEDPSLPPLLYWKPTIGGAAFISSNQGLPTAVPHLGGPDFFFQKNSAHISSGGIQLNDYQYIKVKWLFELLTGIAPVIHIKYGLMIGTCTRVDGVTPAAARTTTRGFHLYSNYWPHELLGNRYRLFNSVFVTRVRRG